MINLITFEINEITLSSISQMIDHVIEVQFSMYLYAALQILLI